jgi:hypothetical protein
MVSSSIVSENTNLLLAKFSQMLGCVKFYRSRLSISHAFIFSIVDYHYHIETRRRIRTNVFETARFIIKAPENVNRWISCVEAKVLALDHRYRLILLKKS